MIRIVLFYLAIQLNRSSGEFIAARVSDNRGLNLATIGPIMCDLL